MGVTRRNFIKFAVGGAAGLGLTPLPYKLVDDSAIWTQTWPWVPVPPKGEFKTIKSVCSLCPGACGIQVRKVDNRAVKIEGRTDYPVNPGGICPKGMGGLQLLYDQDIRFTSPMKRVGPRGSGLFQEIPWDQALRELADRIVALRKKGHPEALAAIDGNRRESTISALIQRLLRTVGSPNYVRMPSLEDTYRTGNILIQGNDGPMAYDLENADYILSFGSGFLEGWGAPGRVMHAWALLREKAVKGKAHVVQIESRGSNTAHKADHWLPARPGTEAALALGIAHVMIKQGVYDKDFVKNNTFGFDRFKAMVLEAYAPQAVSRITGIKEKTIAELAGAFAVAKAPLAVYGKGKGTLNGGLYEFMAVQSLNALVGNINKPGGIILPEPLPLSPLATFRPDTTARKGLSAPRLDQAGTKKYPVADSLVVNLISAVRNGQTSPVDTLMVFSANPAHTLPDTKAVKEALERIPFTVSFSPFRDETAYMADLILPDHTYLEKTDDIVWPAGLQYPFYALSRPVITPLYDTKNTGDVIITLASQMAEHTSGAFPWKNYEAVLKERVKGLYAAGDGKIAYADDDAPAWKWGQGSGKGVESFDRLWRTLKSGGFWYRPVAPPKDGQRIFKTPTNKFEFYSTQIELAVNKYTEIHSQEAARKAFGVEEQGDAVFMPHYEAVKGHASPYALTLVPYEIINLSSDQVPSPPFLYKTLFDHQLLGNDSFAAVNPKTASAYHIQQGDMMTVESATGAVQVRAQLTEGAMPGMVYMPMGFGHTAYDEFIQGKGVNPNDIIDVAEDPLSGQPMWWTTPVNIKKA